MHSGMRTSILTPPPVSMAATRLGYPSRTVVNTGTTGGGTATQVQQIQSFILRVPAQYLSLRFANITNDTSVLSQLNTGLASLTMRGGIQLTAASNPKPLFSATNKATRDVTIASGSTADFTVDLGKVVAAGTRLYLTTLLTFASAIANWPATDVIMSQGTEFNEFGTALTDRTNTAWTTGSRQTNFSILPPIAIWATGSARSVAILGDSISSAGNNDATFGDGIGYVQRALNASGIPWTDNGAQGMTISSFISNAVQKQRRIDFLANTGVTHIICPLGTNDLSGAASDTTIRTNMMLLRTYAAPFGINVIPVTLPPRTNSANNAQVVGDNASVWTWRRNYNDWVRTNPLGDGFFDVAAIFQDATTIDLWRTDLGTPTADGIHPATLLHTPAATALSALLNSGLLG